MIEKTLAAAGVFYLEKKFVYRKSDDVLKSCSYCGRIHDSKYICTQKEQKIRDRQFQRSKENKRVYDFHRSYKWKNKSIAIRERDNYCCQVCKRGLHNPDRQYETDNISVHHIIPVAEDWERRLDDSNLVSLCLKHHEQAEKGQIKRDELLRIAKDQEEKMNSAVCG